MSVIKVPDNMGQITEINGLRVSIVFCNEKPELYDKISKRELVISSL